MSVHHLAHPLVMGSIVFGPLGPHFTHFVPPTEPTWRVPAELLAPQKPEAWECPRCHAINAPTATKCDCKP